MSRQELEALRRRNVGRDRSGIPALREEVREYLARHPAEAEGWRLLSQIEEDLGDLAAAVQATQKAQEVAPDRKDVKRLVRLREQISEFADLGLGARELDALREWLESVLEREGCDHSQRWTERWLRENGRTPSTLQAMQAQGGSCDCEVLANVCCAFR